MEAEEDPVEIIDDSDDPQKMEMKKEKLQANKQLLEFQKSLSRRDYGNIQTKEEKLKLIPNNLK